MTPVLIYTDSNAIADEQTTLANIIPVYQAIYNAIKAATVPNITIAEVDALVQKSRTQNTADYVNDYVTNKLVAAASPFIINGVTVKPEKVKDFIQIPSVTGIKAALNPVLGGNANRYFIGRGSGARINLLSLASDVISAVSDANTQITALYTYYTANDASSTLATQIQAICDALNTFNTANGGIYVKRIPTDRRNVQGDLETQLPGVAISGANNNFIISLSYIRKFEQIGSVNFSM